MINFKSAEERLPSALILISILILAGTLIYMLVVPAPTAAGTARGREMSRQKLTDEIETTRNRTAELRKASAKRLWQGNHDAVTAAVLSHLTREASRRGVRVGAFRPQRTQTLEAVVELPFSVQLAGPYPAVRGVLASLDAPGSRLAMRSVQISTADAASNAVTAVAGVCAYVEAPARAATTQRTSTSSAGARQ